MNKNNNFKIANVTAFESKSVYVPTFDASGTEYYMLNNKMRRIQEGLQSGR